METRKNRLLVVAEGWDVHDGAQTCVKKQIEHLRATGRWEVLVLCPNRPKGVRFRDEEDITFRVKGSSLIPCTRYAYRTRWLGLGARDTEALAAFRPDVVQLSSPGPLARTVNKMLDAGTLHTLSGGMPYVVGMYHTHFPTYLQQRPLIRWLDAMLFGLVGWAVWAYLSSVYRTCHRMLVPTVAMKEAVLEGLTARKGRPLFEPDDVFVVGRGLDTDIFYPPKHKKVRGDKLRVIFVSRLVHEKRVLMLPNILRAILSRMGDHGWEELEFTVCGDGPVFDQLEVELDQVMMHNSRFTYRMVGMVPPRRVAFLFRTHDIFIFPSLTETFGQVLQEAQACGCAVFASDCPVNAENMHWGGGCVLGDDEWQIVPSLYEQYFKNQQSFVPPPCTWEDMGVGWEEAVAEGHYGPAEFTPLEVCVLWYNYENDRVEQQWVKNTEPMSTALWCQRERTGIVNIRVGESMFPQIWCGYVPRWALQHDGDVFLRVLDTVDARTHEWSTEEPEAYDGASLHTPQQGPKSCVFHFSPATRRFKWIA